MLEQLTGSVPWVEKPLKIPGLVQCAEIECLVGLVWKEWHLGVEKCFGRGLVLHATRGGGREGLERLFLEKRERVNLLKKS